MANCAKVFTSKLLQVAAEMPQRVSAPLANPHQLSLPAGAQGSVPLPLVRGAAQCAGATVSSRVRDGSALLAAELLHSWASAASDNEQEPDRRVRTALLFLH